MCKAYNTIKTIVRITMLFVFSKTLENINSEIRFKRSPEAIINPVLKASHRLSTNTPTSKDNFAVFRAFQIKRFLNYRRVGSIKNKTRKFIKARTECIISTRRSYRKISDSVLTGRRFTSDSHLLLPCYLYVRRRFIPYNVAALFNFSFFPLSAIYGILHALYAFVVICPTFNRICIFCYYSLTGHSTVINGSADRRTDVIFISLLIYGNKLKRLKLHIIHSGITNNVISVAVNLILQILKRSCIASCTPYTHSHERRCLLQGCNLQKISPTIINYVIYQNNMVIALVKRISHFQLLNIISHKLESCIFILGVSLFICHLCNHTRCVSSRQSPRVRNEAAAVGCKIRTIFYGVAVFLIIPRIFSQSCIHFTVYITRSFNVIIN